MAWLTCKSTVRFKAFTPALVRLLDAVLRVAETIRDPEEIVITSANDSRHAPNSQHYRDSALDLRTKNFASDADVRRFAALLREELGPAFTVLYEAAGTPNAHLHLQVRKGHIYMGRV